MAPFLIDVRSAEEYASGFLEGAVNIPYTEIQHLHQVFPDIEHDSTISLYCRSGRRTALAETTLREMGFTNVRDLGGLEQASDILTRETGRAGDIPLFVDYTGSTVTGKPSEPVKPVASKTSGHRPYSKEYLQSTADEFMAAVRALETETI